MILFDLDGTLIDSNGVWEEIDLAFLGRHGLRPTEEYTYTIGHSIFPVAAQFTRDYYRLDLTPQEIMDEWDAMARTAYGRVEPKPGAAEFVSRCVLSGRRVAMVTASLPQRCRDTLERLDLARCFEQIVFAQELGIEKRDPLLFLRSAALLGVAAEECVLYEDAPENCAAAKAAGMRVVGVFDRSYHRQEAKMRRICDEYIMSFEELLD